MAREGGCEWYQSIGLKFLYIFADFKNFFKGPRPFKKEKTYLSGLTTPQGALLDHVASRIEYWIAERPMFQSALSRSASLRHSLNCGMERSGITIKIFYWFSLKNRGVRRSAISVIADWLIFLSRKYRNAPCKKNTFIWIFRCGVPV